MNIGFDIRPFLKDESGVGVYLRNLLFALSKIDKENNYFLFSSSFKDRVRRETLPPFKNLKSRDMRIPVSFLNFIWYKYSFPPMGLFFLKKLDIVHSPVPKRLPGGKKKIITVHDLCFIEKPLLVMEEAVEYFKNSFLKEVEKADGIIAVSEFTKSKIIEIAGEKYEEKIRVIYEGSDMDEIESTPPSFNLPKEFLLFVGTIEPRKNLSRLFKAIAILKESFSNIKLVIVGKKGWAYKEILSMIPKLGLDNNIILTNYIKREELKYLYEKSKALIFPSLYEGFGLPILEAIYLKKPVLASNLNVFKEIFNSYPLYFDPLQPESIAETIKSFFQTPIKIKPEDSKKLINKLNWEKTARETLRFYGEIL